MFANDFRILSSYSIVFVDEPFVQSLIAGGTYIAFEKEDNVNTMLYIRMG